MFAYLPELFDTHTRFSSVAVSYNAAAILGGGLAPFIATALVAATHSAWSVAAYLAVTAVISLTCILILPETYKNDLSRRAWAPLAADRRRTRPLSAPSMAAGPDARSPVPAASPVTDRR